MFLISFCKVSRRGIYKMICSFDAILTYTSIYIYVRLHANAMNDASQYAPQCISCDIDKWCWRIQESGSHRHSRILRWFVVSIQYIPQICTWFYYSMCESDFIKSCSPMPMIFRLAWLVSQLGTQLLYLNIDFWEYFSRWFYVTDSLRQLTDILTHFCLYAVYKWSIYFCHYSSKLITIICAPVLLVRCCP